MSFSYYGLLVQSSPTGCRVCVCACVRARVCVCERERSRNLNIEAVYARFGLLLHRKGNYGLISLRPENKSAKFFPLIRQQRSRLETQTSEHQASQNRWRHRNKYSVKNTSQLHPQLAPTRRPQFLLNPPHCVSLQQGNSADKSVMSGKKGSSRRL
jgi:hypothetical protein